MKLTPSDIDKLMVGAYRGIYEERIPQDNISSLFSALSQLSKLKQKLIEIEHILD